MLHVVVQILFLFFFCVKDLVVAETHLPPTSALAPCGSNDDRLLEVEDDRPLPKLASLQLVVDDDDEIEDGDDVKLLQA